jgi:hypothetical protein
MKATRTGSRHTIIAAALCLAPAVALAYINPGNGAYMVQALFTLLGAGMFYLRHPRRLLEAVRLWFANRRDTRPAAAPEHSDGSAPYPTLPDQIRPTDSN